MKQQLLGGVWLLMALSGCGGGGGSNFVPPPPPAPPPSPPPSPPPAPSSNTVTIFPKPTVGEYATIGVWTNVGEWTSAGPTSPDGGVRISTVISADQNQPTVRYTPAGDYEVQLPGDIADRLIHHANVGSPTSDNTLFQSGTQSSRTFQISGSRQEGYAYSELMSWWRPDLDFAFTADFGVMAFGVATPASGVPLSGSGTYNGQVVGITDAVMADGSGGYGLMPAEGTVRLNFDFGAGTLGGEMNLFLNEGMNPRDLGVFAFNQTVFGRGSTTYSGDFATSLAGFNFFNGRFTGPAAEETIGNWAVPFTYDGATHQAIGAWIARRGN